MGIQLWAAKKGADERLNVFFTLNIFVNWAKVHPALVKA
jgi:hypothetical protein